MTRSRITRVDLYGKRFEALLWALAILAALGLFLYGLFGCRWLDQRDPAFVRLAFGAYLVSIAFVVVRRRQLFPWAEKAPGLAIVGGIALAVPFGFAVCGAVLVSNAALDRGTAITRRFSVIRKTDPADVVLAPVSLVGPAEVDLHVGRSGVGIMPGDMVDLEIKPGLFHKPWVRGYRLVQEHR